MQRLTNPIPLFLDGRGALLDAGYVYVGVAGGDPEADPVQLYTDSALTVPIDQPLRTLGGSIVKNANQVLVYYDEDDVSMRIRDANGVLVSYVPSLAAISPDLPVYQPLDSDLTAIAALTTTEFGRSLLTAASAAALKTDLGIAPFTGGTVTSNIIRQGAGAHVYFSNAAMTGARIVGVDPVGTADATSQPGDMQFFY